MTFSSQNDLNKALNVAVCNTIFTKLFINT